MSVEEESDILFPTNVEDETIRRSASIFRLGYERLSLSDSLKQMRGSMGEPMEEQLTPVVPLTTHDIDDKNCNTNGGKVQPLVVHFSDFSGIRGVTAVQQCHTAADVCSALYATVKHKLTVPISLTPSSQQRGLDAYLPNCLVVVLPVQDRERHVPINYVHTFAPTDLVLVSFQRLLRAVTSHFGVQLNSSSTPGGSPYTIGSVISVGGCNNQGSTTPGDSSDMAFLRGSARWYVKSVHSGPLPLQGDEEIAGIDSSDDENEDEMGVTNYSEDSPLPNYPSREDGSTFISMLESYRPISDPSSSTSFSKSSIPQPTRLRHSLIISKDLNSQFSSSLTTSMSSYRRQRIASSDLAYLAKAKFRGYLYRQSRRDLHVWRREFCVLTDKFWCLDIDSGGPTYGFSIPITNRILVMNSAAGEKISDAEELTAPHWNPSKHFEVQLVTIVFSLGDSFCCFRSNSLSDQTQWLDRLRMIALSEADNVAFVNAEVLINDEEIRRAQQAHRMMSSLLNYPLIISEIENIFCHVPAVPITKTQNPSIEDIPRKFSKNSSSYILSRGNRRPPWHVLEMRQSLLVQAWKVIIEVHRYRELFRQDIRNSSKQKVQYAQASRIFSIFIAPYMRRMPPVFSSSLILEHMMKLKGRNDNSEEEFTNYGDFINLYLFIGLDICTVIETALDRHSHYTSSMAALLPTASEAPSSPKRNTNQASEPPFSPGKRGSGRLWSWVFGNQSNNPVLDDTIEQSISQYSSNFETMIDNTDYVTDMSGQFVNATLFDDLVSQLLTSLDVLSQEFASK